jgi:5-methylcytosine-specific restriction protein A
MPQASKRPCTHPGCRHLQPCPVHPPKKAWVKNNDVQRMRGRELQRQRDLLLRRNPLCAECQRQGIITRALYRDHVIPLAEGGTDTTDNTQGLCGPCHEKKTQEEALRGKRK